MNKVRVCFHSEVLSSGCLNHHIKNIAKYINKDKFEIYLATGDISNYGRKIAEFFKKENVFEYLREPGWIYSYNPVTGDYPIGPDEHPLYNFLENNKIDIIHDQRGGGTYFPLNVSRVKAIKVESNIFAGCAPYDGLAMSYCISRGVYNDWLSQMKIKNPAITDRGTVMYPAVDLPITNKDLREELGIASNIIVIGKSSNAGKGDTYNFSGYAAAETNNTLFLAAAMDPSQVEQCKQLGIRNMIVLPIVEDYTRMSMFYNTCDIVAHHRGESFGCSVAEAMMHGKPVVTAGWSNGQFTPSTAQEELIGDRNFCAEGTDYNSSTTAYATILKGLISGGREYCKEKGEWFKQRAMSMCAAPLIVSRLEQSYEELVGIYGRIS